MFSQIWLFGCGIPILDYAVMPLGSAVWVVPLIEVIAVLREQILAQIAEMYKSAQSFKKIDQELAELICVLCVE